MCPLIKNKYLILLFIAAIAITNNSCGEYLDAKPDKKLAVPTTLPDLQALLDNYAFINRGHPIYGEVSADDYYLTGKTWASLTDESDREMYIWVDQFPFGQINDWFYAYRIVYYANQVLDNLPDIGRRAGDTDQWDDMKGQALFHRANAFLQIASIWAQAYDPATADADLGIPLRSTSDFNEVSRRASNQDTYERITTDLKEAIALLPARTVHVMRPSRLAAYGLLSRAYFFMRQYENARVYADSCLEYHHDLLDYNSLDVNDPYPMPEFNSEIIWYARTNLSQPLYFHQDIAKIDSTLYELYDDDDLRKLLFFTLNEDGSYGFKGSYTSDGYLFAGVAVDEILLIRAECNLRTGNIQAALADFNTLLRHRYTAGAYQDIITTDQEMILKIILEERRKELLMRGLRWPDIKRLNKEGQGIILHRNLNGKSYILEPNDPRYALPIPEDVIDRSDIIQNPR